MKKFILIVFAFAFAALATTVQASGTGMPMMKGLESPTELADMVDVSLENDSTGNGLLDEDRCKENGSCATALDYFEGIHRAHPSAKLGDIAELSRYLRSLVKQPAPEGEWFMSRMLVKGEKHTYDHAAWKRTFFKNEVVWDDSSTGEHILAGDCGNVVAAGVAIESVGLAEDQCVELTFTAPVGGKVRWGMGTVIGPLDPDKCNAQREGGDDWLAWYGECDVCAPAIEYIRTVFDNGNAYVPHKYMYGVTESRQTLRFSKEIWKNLVYICLEDADGRQSCGVYQRPQDWQNQHRVDIPDSMWIWGNCPK